MKKINYLILSALLLTAAGTRAQDIHFSQIYETPVFLSPANTGFFNGYVRAIANYRNQWASMNNAYQTMAVSLDGGLFKSKKRPAFMGLGITIFNDKAGVAKMQTTTAMVNMSGLVRLGKKSAMSAALGGGASAASADYSKLTYESQFNGNTIDPSLNSQETPYRQFTTVDVSAGLAYEFTDVRKDPDHDDLTSVKISVGAFHLNKPNQEYGLGSQYRLPVRMTYAATSVLDITDTKFTVTPAVVFNMQDKYRELILGTYFKVRMRTGTKVTGEKTQNQIGLGLFFRNKDAIIPKLIFDLGDFSVGMAYDVNVSAYRTASNGMGGFEVSLRYNRLADALFESRKEYR
jgi:type IX secretion system PorP/SprF family membrane protein